MPLQKNKKTRGVVVVVEDDADTREALVSAVEAEGFAAICASDGAEALRLLQQIEPPRLILLDLMMPVMDGWQFRKEQRKDPRLADIPVVVLTAGNTAPWDVESVILKPITSDKLRRALSAAQESS